MDNDECIKVISMDSLLYEKKGKRSAVTKIVEPKIPKKRVITTTDKWNFTVDELDPIQQLEYVRQIMDACGQRAFTPSTTNLVGDLRSPDKFGNAYSEGRLCCYCCYCEAAKAAKAWSPDEYEQITPRNVGSNTCLRRSFPYS